MGARSASLVRAPFNNVKLWFTSGKVVVLLLASILISCSCTLAAAMSSDAEALLKFRDSLTNVVALSSWDQSINPKPPCSGNVPNWVGLFCINDKVWGLRLENMGLTGNIDVNSLGSITGLRSISLMNNTFVGPLPSVRMLPNLKALYLSYNHFSGQIPDDEFTGLHRLRKLYLANNEFTGNIPSSLTTLPSLLILRLDSNKFQGQIPQFQRNNKLKTINLSYNDLEGPIPANLSTFNASSFKGNPALCGPPLAKKCEAAEMTPSKMRLLKTLLAVIGVALIVAILVAVLVICRLRSQKQQQPTTEHQTSTLQGQGQASKKHIPSIYVKTKSLADHYNASPKANSDRGHGHSRRGEQGKLTFIKQDHDQPKFDLQDLLKASAEILGSAGFGSSYKAVVLDGQAVVVKRYKHMNNVPREEFHEHMRRLGNLNHPNLLPLLAYYYRKDEKLLLTTFVDNGCLATHLHGNHNYQKGLDWPTRLKIVKGVARGLAYLYSALPSVIVPHGHLKSSNVLLDESFEPLLTDYALSPMINLDHAQQIIMPYKSPEYAQLGRITKKTDVWSLGILILEILTGKFPENYLTLRHNTDSNIASWVNTMITEKRTSDVFDIEMGGIGNSKAELLKLLKIGLSCCEENVERRLDMKEALEQIEDLKEGENDAIIGEYSSSLVTNERNAYRAV